MRLTRQPRHCRRRLGASRHTPPRHHHHLEMTSLSRQEERPSKPLERNNGSHGPPPILPSPSSPRGLDARARARRLRRVRQGRDRHRQRARVGLAARAPSDDRFDDAQDRRAPLSRRTARACALARAAAGVTRPASSSPPRPIASEDERTRVGTGGRESGWRVVGWGSETRARSSPRRHHDDVPNTTHARVGGVHTLGPPALLPSHAMAMATHAHIDSNGGAGAASSAGGMSQRVRRHPHPPPITRHHTSSHAITHLQAG